MTASPHADPSLPACRDAGGRRKTLTALIARSGLARVFVGGRLALLEGPRIDGRHEVVAGLGGRDRTQTRLGDSAVAWALPAR